MNIPISYNIVKGGLNDIPDNSNSGKTGIAYKLFNKQDVEPFTNIVKEKVIPQMSERSFGIPFEIEEINIYHKPHSRYKWLIYIVG